MKFYIGDNNAKSLKHAADWIRVKDILGALETWGRKQESAWGECCIFLETTLPQANRRNTRHSVDLLVAFDDRAAICEMKRGGAPTIDVRDLVNQVCGQEEAFEALLRRRSYGSTFGRVVFCPAMGSDALIALRKQIANEQNQPHFFVAGGLEQLRAPARDGTKYHLIDVFDVCLRTRVIDRSANLPGVQHYIERTLNQGGWRLTDPLPHATAAIATLRSYAISPHVSFGPFHVENARESEYATALSRLLNTHVIELCGPPQIGKSTLARELIRELKCQTYEVNLDRSTDSIGRRVEEQVENAPDYSLPEEDLPARLAGENAVFWIKRYHEGCRLSVGDFIRRLASFRRLASLGSATQAYCVVESNRALEGCGEFRVDIGAMSRPKLALILEKRPKGESVSTAEFVLDHSLGNPGTAIRMWTADNPIEQEPTEFGWFENQLKAGDKRIMFAICYATARTPFGLSGALLERFVGRACSDLLPSARKDAVFRVLELMKAEQLADVSAFTREQFGGLLDEIVPTKADMTFVNSIDTRLLSAVVERIDSKRRERWQSEFELAVIDAAEPGNLAESIYCLGIDRDLEPFFRSSFRHTSLGGTLLSWIEASGWEPEGRQAYLLKALRVLAALSRDKTIHVPTELGTPQDAVQLFANEFVRARQMVVESLSPTFDVQAPRARIDNFSDPLLRAVWYTSCASALQEAGREREAWHLLRDISQQLDTVTTAAAIVRFQIANFVNSKEGRAYVDAEEGKGSAFYWTTECARILVDSGIQFENIHLISAGLFYYVRASEFSMARDQFDKVLGYLVALNWIESIPGSRARWRMKALLTRGSIHRHFLRQQHLTWDEVALHLQLASSDYNRAFRSAHRAGHVLHSVQPVSYNMRLCRTALRHWGRPDARKVILECARETLEQCRIIRTDLILRGLKELSIWANIQRAEPLLRYLVIIPDEPEDWREHIRSINDQWRLYIDSLLCRQSARDHDGANDALKDLVHIFQFAEALSSSHHLRLFGAVRSHVERLLRATAPRRPGQRPPPSWTKLSELCSRYQNPNTELGDRSCTNL
jgi:hypothetical protein